VSSVSPLFIAQGRNKTIQIRGSRTKWNEESLSLADISFGPGVTVDALTIANEQNLLVEITSDLDAEVGTRTVTVGEDRFRDAFRVQPPFVLIGDTTPSSGAFLSFGIRGYDTDWLQGTTTIDLGPRIYTSGAALGHSLTATVLRPDFIEVFAFVDLYATAGAVDATITGVTSSDTITGFLDIAEPQIPNLTQNSQTTHDLDTPMTPVVLRAIPSFGEALTFSLDNASGGAEPLAFVFTPGSGRVPAARADLLQAHDRLVFDPAGEVLFVAVYEAKLRGDASFDFTLGYVGMDLAPTELADSVDDTMNTFAAAGQEDWYYFSGTAWSLGTVVATPTAPGMSSELESRLTLRREGVQDVLTDIAADNVTPATLTALQGSRSLLFAALQDDDGNAVDATSEYTIGWTETAVAGTLTESSDTNVALLDALVPTKPASTTSTLEVAAGSTIAVLHVMVDIDHGQAGELDVEISSPQGTTVKLVDGDGAAKRGFVEAFPDTVAADLSAFVGEDSTGTWTLTVTDKVPGDSGSLAGWAISVE
jgi:subtilisin-like proprotein convertase family protein